MPEELRTPTQPTDAELVRIIAAATLAVPEVIRLEPTLRARMRQLSHSPVASISQLDSGGRSDGVSLRTRDDRTEVILDIAVDPADRSAAEVAEAIENLVGRLLTDAGREPGPIKVAVLAVESAANEK